MKSERGFTVIEVVIVMVIVGILAIVAIPQVMGTMSATRLNNAAQKLAADIRYAKEFALSRHNVYGVDINTSTNTYEIFSWDGVNKTVINDPYTNAPMSTDLDLSTEYSGVTISAASIDEIRINAFGTPQDSLGTNLTSAATITLANGGLTRQVQITHETALVEVI